MDFKEIVKDIDTLPPLSDTAKIIAELSRINENDKNIIDLVRLIESDALLTANILHIINAPYYGFSQKISSVAQAVTLFGTRTLYGVVLNFSINNLIKANMRPYCLTNIKFNDICHLQSALMNEWFSKIDLHHAQLLTPLALIMESGKLIVSREVVRKGMIKEFSEGLAAAEDCVLYEHSLFGSSSYFISGLLFEHWKFDPLYVEILKALDYERPTTPQVEAYIESLDVVRTAVNVKEQFSEESLQKAVVLVEKMGFFGDDFLHVAKRIKRRYEAKR